MTAKPTTTDLESRLREFGQEHLLRFASELSKSEREDLYRQVAALDFDRLDRLFREAAEPATEVETNAIEPVPVIELPRNVADRARDEAAAAAGWEALKAGRVAVVLVAGGQGSRLGFEHPKGMFPIGPVRGTTLFQIHAEKILAYSRKIERAIPWYIMTSPTNRRETEDFFRANGFFGLDREAVRFFEQGTLPAVDLKTGRVLLSAKGEVFSSPNGHGGTLEAMRQEGILDDLAQRGADLVYYFQVDNPFAKVLEPAFLGHHLQCGAEISLKVIRKVHPNEKLGLAVQYQGKPTIIEYSDLPAELGSQTDAQGNLRFWTGSIAIHVFSRSLLERLTSSELSLPVHFARKKVPYIDDSGSLVRPAAPNALKFEMFIFDCLSLSRHACVVETDRNEEYEPVKNATGEHSPEVVQKAISRRAAAWLEQAGVRVPRDDNGEPAYPLEISPLAGIDGNDFAARLTDRAPVRGPKAYA